MANLPETANWEAGVTQLEPTDPAAASVLNAPHTQLANRTAYLKQLVDQLGLDVANLQASFDAEGMNAVWGALIEGASQRGFLAKQIDALQRVARQRGEITIANRGVIDGCWVTKSSAATRNLDLAAGRIFAHGRPFSVPAQNNAAVVPSNPGSAQATAWAYLYEAAPGDWQLAVTPLDASPPDTAIVLYRLDVPAGNDEVTDPYLANVALIAVYRAEPAWPQMLQAPAGQIVPIQPMSSQYTVHFDVLDYEGGPEPVLVAPDAERTTANFTVYVVGGADMVRLRWSLDALEDGA